MAIAELNPIRYRGYYYDSETGLYYLQSRYYNPEIGRFMNADSQTDSGASTIGFNLFAYAANNPVNNSDPTGHSILATLLGKAAIGFAFGFASNVITQCISGKSLKEVDYKKAALDGCIGAVTSMVSFGLGKAVKTFVTTSRALKVAATAVSGGITSVVQTSLSTAATEGRMITALEASTSLVNGTLNTCFAMGVSAVFNHSNFGNLTKRQKHSALNSESSSKVTHRQIKNGNHTSTMNYTDYLIKDTDTVADGIGLFYD